MKHCVWTLGKQSYYLWAIASYYHHFVNNISDGKNHPETIIASHNAARFNLFTSHFSCWRINKKILSVLSVFYAWPTFSSNSVDTQVFVLSIHVEIQDFYIHNCQGSCHLISRTMLSLHVLSHIISTGYGSSKHFILKRLNHFHMNRHTSLCTYTHKHMYTCM